MVTCDLGTVASGANAAVTIVVMPTTTGPITNSVEVTANEPDANLGNNTDSEQTAVNELLCNGLIPTRVGTPGSETITDTNGRDVIHALGGNGVINAKGGDDVVCGGEGNDTLIGSFGSDRLLGGGR